MYNELKVLWFQRSNSNSYKSALSFPSGALPEEVDEDGWLFWVKHGLGKSRVMDCSRLLSIGKTHK